MNDRIFLHKYRLSEMGSEPAAESEDHSSVHQGVEIESGRKVRIETYRASSLSTAAREQLQTEANAARRLSHINVPVLYDFGIEGDDLVYVSEHFDGTTAGEWIKAYGPMPVSPVLSIASQVVSALSAAAFHRIIHANITPQDLLLSPGQTTEGAWPLVKVLHLTGGAPRPSRAESVVTDSNKPDPYASPERIQHGTIDFRSEMYSLGATIWFLLTGAPPLAAPKDPSPRTSLSPAMLNAVPRSVRGLLAQMLSPNPEARPGDPLALSRLLQDCASHLHDSEATATPRSPAPSSKRLAADSDRPESQWNRKRVLVVAAVPVLIALLSLVAVSGYFGPRRPLPVQKPIRAPVSLVRNIPSAPTAAPVIKVETTKPVAEKNVAPEIANLPPVKGDFVQRAAINLVLPPAWPKSLSLFPVLRPPERAYGPPSSISAFPDTINSAKIVPAAQVEVPTAARLLPNKWSETAASKKGSPRRPFRTEPEARRAEPEPPAEGISETPKPTQTPPKSPSKMRDNARSGR